MRVIAGSAKHLNLKTIEGLDSRPTTDRIKETLFNMLQTDVFQALGRLAGRGAYDFIFMDPPYNHEWEKQVLQALRNSDLTDAYTVLIVEASLETDFSWVESMGYKIKKYKKYKTNAHVFIEKKNSDDAVRE